MLTSMADTINSNIERDAIAGVKSISVDGMHTEVMPIDERIKGAEHLARQTAQAKNHLGLRMVQLVPPGGGP